MSSHKPMCRAISRIERRVPIQQALTVQEWRDIQDIIVKALAPYTEARVAVAEALVQADRMLKDHGKH
jgi:hypothetical protein